MIRCKFKCERIQLMEHGAEIRLSPVITGSDENAKFFRHTPAGELTLAIVPNGTATASFEPGKEYYIDITPAG